MDKAGAAMLVIALAGARAPEEEGPTPGEWLKGIARLFELISESGPAIALSVAGMITFVITVLLVYKAVRSDPGQLPRWFTFCVYFSLTFAVLLSLAGPSIRLVQGMSSGIPVTSAVKAIEKLRVNGRVRWLVRLIPYRAGVTNELDIAHLTALGSAGQRFVFVADYEELRGRTAEAAVEMVGGSLADADRVSAIIFPLERRMLFPANALGLLQVVARIDGEQGASAGYQAFAGSMGLNQEQTRLLTPSLDDLRAWSWERLAQHYVALCGAAQRFRCDERYSAHRLMGSLNRDWNPLGFAQRSLQTPCEGAIEEVCKSGDWDEVRPASEEFGARIFLIENYALEQLDGRVLVHFSDPERQVIPDIGLRP